MSKHENVSIAVIKRLPRYYRYLAELKHEGIVRISSRELSARMGLTASQIRQDLNCFGGFGQQGYGYNIDMLYIEIGRILGVDSGYKTILIGAGNLGRAIATHMNFSERGFNLLGIFARNEAIAGQMINGIPVHPMTALDDFCKDNKPQVAVLCIPLENAESVTASLVSLGIKGFWNFSHRDLSAKFPEAAFENVHLSDSLMTLCYRVSHEDAPKNN
ncbi:MAG: redox-sensing transcriptional repressor Rex [Clostridiales bacterium]|nr:redox-sensing transcriptional repressor Rex [Clostridiales bacterium]